MEGQFKRVVISSQPILHFKCSVDEITELLDRTDVTIIPTINPDGFDRAKEGACSGADYKTGRYELKS